jgi:lysophospholipase L1-like esterase
MNILKKVGIFGDSILKGVQVDSENKCYHVDNHIDYDLISREHSLEINNYSIFGCTILKGKSMLDKRLANGKTYKYVILEYGGNDCDYNWKAIAEHPDAEYIPNTPLQVFFDTYQQMIKALRDKCITPVLATLPPLEPQRFFDWFCQGLNKDNVMKWLGGNVNTIYRVQESYSRMVESIASETRSLLVDLRGAFLSSRRIDHLICEDGTHPNTAGQYLITEALRAFADKIAA